MDKQYIKLPISILNNPKYGLMPDWIWCANIELMYFAERRTGRIDDPDELWPCTRFSCKDLHEAYDYLRSVGVMSCVMGVWYHDDAKKFEVLCADREPIPRELRRYIMERDGHTCRYCGAPAEHIDHIYPVARGGTNSPDNLAAACARCNMTKKARTPEEAGMSITYLEGLE